MDQDRVRGGARAHREGRSSPGTTKAAGCNPARRWFSLKRPVAPGPACATQGRLQVAGELVRPSRRDDVALFSKARQRLRERLDGVGDTAAEPAYLGEIHEPVALPIQAIRTADQFDRLGYDRVG